MFNYIFRHSPLMKDKFSSVAFMLWRNCYIVYVQFPAPITHQCRYLSTRLQGRWIVSMHVHLYQDPPGRAVWRPRPQVVNLGTGMVTIGSTCWILRLRTFTNMPRRSIELPNHRP